MFRVGVQGPSAVGACKTSVMCQVGVADINIIVRAKLENDSTPLCRSACATRPTPTSLTSQIWDCALARRVQVVSLLFKTRDSDSRRFRCIPPPTAGYLVRLYVIIDKSAAYHRQECRRIHPGYNGFLAAC